MSLAIPGIDIQFLAITFSTAIPSEPNPPSPPPSIVGLDPGDSPGDSLLSSFESLPLFSLPRM